MNINVELSNVIFAFSLTLFAGLATSVGSFIGFFANRTNTKFLATSLGFSAGVMIYVSLVEIFVKANDAISSYTGSEKMGAVWTVVGFFGGIFVIAIIDKLIPEVENPHEMHSIEECCEEAKDKVDTQNPLLRMGLFTALAIAIHNFPEGLATFTAALSDPSLGIAIAVAIAIHNIPEGIAVSVPVFYATGSRKKAFLYSFISGIAEPIGAIIGYLILRPFMNDLIFGILFSSVAGIMVFISLDELLPSAQKYGEHHLSIYGLIAGMAVMAVSLLLFM